MRRRLLRSRSLRSCWSASPSDGSCVRAKHARACSPTSPNRRAITSGSGRSRARSAGHRASREAPPRSATSSACSIRRPCRALSRGRRSSARSWPAAPPTDTAPRIPVTSGGSGSTSSAPPTGCHRVLPRPGQRARTRGRARCSSAPANEGCSGRGDHHRRQGVRRRRVRSAVASLAANFSAPTAATRSPGSATSAASDNGSSRSTTPSKANSPWRTTAATPSPASGPASANASSHSQSASGIAGLSGNRTPRRTRPPLHTYDH